MLPRSVLIRIESLLEPNLPSSLATARKQLTHRYQTPYMGGFASPSEALAYMASRFPATFAAIQAVLPHVPLEDVGSVLDLGAGPGTASLAAALYWPHCTRFYLIENDTFMSELSQKFLQDLPEIAHQTFCFQQSNVLSTSFDTPVDLVLMSYVLSELPLEDQLKTLQKAWDIAVKGLVIVTPGTPHGYQQLMILREVLIERGAFIAAPCPQHKACPLLEGDWCHFSTRLARSSFHREIKGGTLSYEDEKFSYLVALRRSVSRSRARIIRKPLKRSGHVTFDLCTPEGLQRQTISRRDKVSYKNAIHTSWGDAWDG